MTGDRAFERWVSRQLHKAYDEVLAEEVPKELLDLVEHWSAAETPGEPDPAAPTAKQRRRQP